jgi:hypothetical protein
MSGLRFTSSDGSIATVTIHDTGSNVWRQMQYTPVAPEIAVVEASDALSDGGEIPIAAYRNVTETVEIYIGDVVSATAARAVLNSINLLFQQARTFQRSKLGPRIYVEFRPENGDSWYRSELLNGKVSPHEDVLGWQLINNVVIATATFTRRHYWEGPEAYLPLTNSGASNQTGGLTVNSANGGSYDHWFSIPGASIGGDLPAPCRVEITNTYASGSRGSAYHIGHSAVAPVSPNSLFFEAESMTIDSFGTGTSSSGNYSNNAVQNFGWTNSSAIEVRMTRAALSGAVLAAASGGWYRMMASIPAFAGDFRLQAKILIAGVTPIWEGPWIAPQSSSWLQDLGVVQLPPYVVEASAGGGMYPLDLAIYMRTTAGGTFSFSMDYLALLPTEGYHTLRQRGYGLPQNARLVDDMILGVVYSDGWSGGGRIGNFISYGSGIELVPGRTNYLCILGDMTNGQAPAAMSMSVRVAYRPRRLTL